MSVKWLQDYNNWIGKSPQTILEAVNKAGWGAVFNDPIKFPKGLPIWAHRVRNYFNREPYFLSRLDQKESKNRLKKLDSSVNIEDEGRFNEFIRSRALTINVYVDESGFTVWFQMSAGGTIYHFKHVKNKTKEAMIQTVLGQSNTPIFKLISPDVTGGSCETIIKNLVQARSTVQQLARKLGPLTQLPNSGDRGSSIGYENAVTPVSHLIENDKEYQGSYNYAETAVLGIAKHEKFDIEPHENYAKWGYDNPTDRHSKLESRRFEKYAKGEVGKIPLAEQIYP
jgi:hypothetical protein